MLITKTPFRVSFCGGGSDLPSFYEKHGGCVLSASINKYMYISIHPYFTPHITVLKYSKTEKVEDQSQIKHKIFKAVLSDLKINGVEITSTADIPAGTGLGSSSAFTVGLLHALYCYLGKFVSKARLASEAAAVEIEKLGSPIGKQDQYAASFGGLNYIRFEQDGSVSVHPVMLTAAAGRRLQKNLVLYYLGDVRPANKILLKQQKNMDRAGTIKTLLQMCALTREMKRVLESGRIEEAGAILHESWLLKGTLQPNLEARGPDLGIKPGDHHYRGRRRCPVPAGVGGLRVQTHRSELPA